MGTFGVHLLSFWLCGFFVFVGMVLLESVCSAYLVFIYPDLLQRLTMSGGWA